MSASTGEVEMGHYEKMDIYEAEQEYSRWVEDEVYNTVIIPQYVADLDQEMEDTYRA